MQFTVVTKGTLNYFINQQKYSVSAGQGFFISSNCIHESSAHNNEPCEFYCINFDPEKNVSFFSNLINQKYVKPFLPPNFIDNILLTTSVPWQKEILTLLDKLLIMYHKKSYGYELAIQINVCQMWLILICAIKDMVKQKSITASVEQERIKNLIVYINLNFMNRISLADIAASANISSGECCRLFNKMLKISPIQYLNNNRISQSIKLLLDTRLSILQISEAVGFSSVSYFISFFKRAVGFTPKEYRKMKANINSNGYFMLLNQEASLMPVEEADYAKNSNETMPFFLEN